MSKAPGLYSGQPDDMMTLDPEVLRIELEGFATIFDADEKKALMAGGEVAGRIEDLPTVGELVAGGENNGGSRRGHPQSPTEVHKGLELY